MDPVSPEPDDRGKALRDVAFELRALLSETDRVAQNFAADHGMSGSDFRALLHVVVSETDGTPLTASALRSRLNVSAGAVTYIVDRLVRAGHVRRETNSRDRRKTMLRYSDDGFRLAQDYFRPIGEHYRIALSDVPDDHLMIATRVIQMLVDAMRTVHDDDGASASA